MLIRTFESRDLARLTELTIETFGPFYQDSFRPLVGDVIFTRQHGQWREDYHALLATLHDPAHDKHVAVADIGGMIAGYVGWEIDLAREHGRIEILAVDAHHRRGHLGTGLCERAFEHIPVDTGGLLTRGHRRAAHGTVSRRREAGDARPVFESGLPWRQPAG